MALSAHRCDPGGAPKHFEKRFIYILLTRSHSFNRTHSRTRHFFVDHDVSLEMIADVITIGTIYLRQYRGYDLTSTIVCSFMIIRIHDSSLLSLFLVADKLIGVFSFIYNLHLVRPSAFVLLHGKE